MKIYLNLLSFAWGICCWMPLAVAETTRPENIPTHQEDITEIIDSTTESVTESSTETSETKAVEVPEKTPQQELEAAFPGCPVVVSDIPVVKVFTITPSAPEEDSPELLADNPQENLATIDSELVAESTVNTTQEVVEHSATDLADVDLENPRQTQTKADIVPEIASETEVVESPTIETPEISESKTGESATGEIEASAESKIDCPTEEELARYQQFVKADKLYKAGDKAAAVEIYRELKEAWTTEITESEPAIYETSELSPGGKVYWRTYQQGKAQNLSSKIFTPLEFITERDPNFVPGHIAYAQELIAVDKVAQAHLVMERAIGLYPQDVTLLRAKIEQDVTTERWLEASIAARQFALFNPEHPEQAEFTDLANRYLQTYQDEVKEELTWNAIGNAITGVAGFALTGNLFGPISAIETTLALLQGEDKLGSRFAKRAAKQLPMVEDEVILEYVQRIGDQIASVAGRDEFEYEFYVIMDDNLNAFALPGGKIFVNLGAIMETDSEAELAGLLAHEVAHSVLSHGFQLVTRGNLTANVAQYIPYIGSTAGNLIVLNYSRSMERQADIFGTRILVAADYSADGVKNLMENLVRSHEELAAERGIERPEPPAWLSTHPQTEQRIAYIKELIISNKLNRYAYEGVAEHQLIKVQASQVWQAYQAEQNAEMEAEPNPDVEVNSDAEAETNPDTET